MGGAASLAVAPALPPIAPASPLNNEPVESAPNTELEWYNFDCPRRKGDFEVSSVADFESEKMPLRVKPRLPVAGSSYLPMYSVMKL